MHIRLFELVFILLDVILKYCIRQFAAVIYFTFNNEYMNCVPCVPIFFHCPEL